MSIKVYRQEIKDGLENLVRANASIAYLAQPTLIDNVEKQNKIIASLQDGKDIPKDLYYLECILASVGWNGNDDVFPPFDTFAAKDTPVNKPVNFMHKENDIIGHMVASSVFDENGKAISEPIDKFDIVSGSVLYKVWADKELQERMNKIIAEIPLGKWFVSMECLFAGFDYAIITPDGQHKVIARNEESAFLTKHLKVYGGAGEFDGNKVGRLLRNFFFSGKGIVDNPANKRSIIFNGNNNSVAVFHGTSASITTLNKGRTMDIEILKAQLEEMKKELASEKAKSQTFEAKAREEADKAVAEKIATLDKTIAELQKTIADKEELVKANETKIAEFVKVLAEKDTKIGELTKNVSDLNASMVKAGRLSKLATAGVAGEEAEKFITKFAAASEEIFDEFVALKAASKDKEKMKDDKKEDKTMCSDTTSDKTGESKAEATDLDKLKAEEEAALAANNNKLNEQRTAAAAFIAKNILKTTASQSDKK